MDDMITQRREAKARRLADLFWHDCSQRLANMDAQAGRRPAPVDAGIVARAGEGCTDGVWQMVAAKGGENPPTPETIDLARRALRYRADHGRLPAIGIGCL